MNQQGVGHQPLRGPPNGFSGQQIPQTRSVSSRLPQGGKMAPASSSTWAFGGGPMGGGGVLGGSRPATSFAQTIGGGASQLPKSLDLSDFPSLGRQLPSTNTRQTDKPELIFGTNRVSTLPGNIAQSSIAPTDTTITSNHSGLRSPVESIRGDNESFPQTISRDGSAPPSVTTTAPRQDGAGLQSDPINRTGTADSSIGSSHGIEESSNEVVDPLAFMAEKDKFGLKGFTYMMQNYPDYAACKIGPDVSTMGFDLNSELPFSRQHYSLFDREAARPAVPHFKLPECYSVHNTAPLGKKIPNLNDEALMFMFYTNPGDIQQVMAAQELHQRNWRYHKKLQMWLTKDNEMVPQSLGNGIERGYYIFFDIKQWARERREFTLVYEDLESIINGPRPLP